MVKIVECSVGECAYNRENMCHTMAITVGNGIAHKCDTFCPSPGKGGDPNAMGAVGACKAESCRFNQSLECTATGIRVGREGSLIDCLTFSTG